MGSFFKAGIKEENTKIPVRLLKPNKEKMLKIEVTESNDRLARIYMKKLIAYAKTIGKTTKIKGNSVAIEFESEEIAAEIRKQWEEALK